MIINILQHLLPPLLEIWSCILVHTKIYGRNMNVNILFIISIHHFFPKMFKILVDISRNLSNFGENVVTITRKCQVYTSCTLKFTEETLIFMISTRPRDTTFSQKVTKIFQNLQNLEISTKFRNFDQIWSTSTFWVGFSRCKINV